MMAELPSIMHQGLPVTYNVGHYVDHGQITHSADVINRDHFPTMQSSFVKHEGGGKNGPGKYSDTMAIPKLERAKTLVPTNENLNVDHKHYEQWARVPGRRLPNSGALLRGIQQLKARLKRESLEMEYKEQRNFHINQLQRNSLLTRDRAPDESAPFLRRERSNISQEMSVSKMQPPPRYAMKTNLHVFDSEVLVSQEPGGANETDVEDRNPISELNDSVTIKPRHGVSKIRDRCALPVSVYQPITIGEHVFLVNEPIKYAEYLSLKKTEYRVKKDPKSATMIIMPDRASNQTFPVTPDQSNILKPEEPKRAKTMLSGFRMSTNQKRAPATVSSAEVFDFSQLSQIRNSMEGKLLERSKTEFSFSNKSGKQPRWVPNVQKHIKDYGKRTE